MAEAKLMLNTLWGEWQRVDKMRWQKKKTKKTDDDRAAVETSERMDPRVKCSLWRWAIRDLHRTIKQLGCSAGQERDGMGEPAPGISIITTLPRSRHGDY